MGVFKKFIGGLACESLQTAINYPTTTQQWAIKVPEVRTTDGVSYNYFYVAELYNINGFHLTASYMMASAPYGYLSPVATADTLDNYSIQDYQIEGIGNTTVSTSRSIDSLSEIFTISIGNNTESSIVVNAIKFKKTDMRLTNSSSWPAWPDATELLVCAYYLDSPLTIPAGESRTITIEMKVGTDVSVNET